MRRYSILLALLLTLVLGLLTTAFGADAKPNGPERWESTIAQFEQQDKANPPLQGGILLLGSSSIRQWNVKKWFPDMPVLNRGFGGSQIADSLHYADRVVVPYRPRVLVFYAGDNDIAAGKTPETVLADYKKFVARVHKQLPETKIVFVAIKPSLSRWKLVGTIRRANQMVREVTSKDKRLEFVDVDTPMIGPDGKPRAELFAKDGLHLSDAGYQLWTDLVMPHVK